MDPDPLTLLPAVPSIYISTLPDVTVKYQLHRSCFSEILEIYRLAERVVKTASSRSMYHISRY